MNLPRLTAVACGLLGLATVSASAMPSVQAPLPGAAIVQVSGGCGPAFHRGYYGRCVPNYAPAYRACPWGYHLGRFGRRCWPN